MATKSNSNSESEDFDLTRLDQEARIQLALKAYHKSKARTDISASKKLSLQKAAVLYEVPCSTLAGHFDGLHTHQEAHEEQQNLTNAQEDILVAWAKSMGCWAVPLTATSLHDYATALCSFEVSASWVGRFMNHHPEVKTQWTQSLESCCAKSVNYTSVQGFFQIYDEIIHQYNIPPENIYNCDEKGMQLGVGRQIKAIIDCEQKNVYNVEDGNHKMVTVIEMVCADGTALHPSVIFQGKRTNLAWGKNNPSKAR